MKVDEHSYDLKKYVVANLYIFFPKWSPHYTQCKLRGTVLNVTYSLEVKYSLSNTQGL